MQQHRSKSGRSTILMVFTKLRLHKNSRDAVKRWALASVAISSLSACSLLLPSEEGERIKLGERVKIASTLVLNKPQSGRHGELTDRELELASIAWKYFENNYNEATGLVNAVDNFPSTTMWDTGSYIGALVSAYELKLIAREEFSKRMIALLTSMNTMDLYKNELPNKVYNTETGSMVDYSLNPDVIGFSALDIGRLLIWMKIVKERYPMFSDSIDNAVLRWSFCNVIDEYGTLYGAIGKNGQNTHYLQEGRLGYEEYAAKGFQLWGFNAFQSARAEPYEVINLYGVDVPYDARDPRKLAVHNYVVTDSYALDGLELNWDLADDQSTQDYVHSHRWMADFAQRIYLTQERRFQNTGIITARTEHQLENSPYFVYDTIYTNGYAWNTITESGEYVPEYAATSVKGALSMWALWETDYTNLLFDTVSSLYDPERGFYEGKYENGKGVIKTHTANSNGVVLASLLYKQQGKLLKYGNYASRWDKVIADQFQGYEQCLPREDLQSYSASSRR